MFPNLQKYMELRHGKELPTVMITREEFVQMFIEAGKTPEQAELQAKVAEGLDSMVVLGDKKVGIKK